MTALSSAQGEAWENDEKEDRVRYVEELEEEGDYWLSITDAARVCRVQDVSIRRAITRGALPVRRQRAGQNKRTRFVRAHDLAKAGFPIIDESAAITTEVGKADILSIPRQQQHILQEHQRLMSSLDEMQQRFADYQVKMQADLQDLRDQWQGRLRAWQEESRQLLAQVEIRLAQDQEQLHTKLAEAERQRLQDLEQVQGDLALLEQRFSQEQQQLTQVLAQVRVNAQEQETRFQNALSIQATTLETYQAENLQRLEELSKLQQEHFGASRQAFQQAQEQTRQQLLQQEQRLHDDLKNARQTTAIQLQQLTEQIATLQQTDESLKSEIAAKRQDLARITQHQQAQLDEHAQLLPLLPYSGQRLVNEQDLAECRLALTSLEQRLLAEQERYRLLLPLLTPERLAALEQLLATFPQQTIAETKSYVNNEKP